MEYANGLRIWYLFASLLVQDGGVLHVWLSQPYQVVALILGQKATIPGICRHIWHQRRAASHIQGLC